jgi:hypothetical protein
MTKLCDECETVAHCLKHGCIPKIDFWKDYEPEPTRPAPVTKDEALDLALEALEFFKGLALSVEEIERAEEAITAIKQARSAPVQDSTCNNSLREQGKAYPRTCRKCGLGPCIALANIALDKKAENARELGLDYEPDYKVTVVDDQHPKGVPLEQWGRSAPVQEPVAFFDWYDNAHWGNEDFKEGCHRSWNAAIKYITPPAAQRQWVGLTDDEFENIELGCRSTPFGKIEAMRKVETKLKEKNT